ncbi:hypothetical protein H9L19_07530 [Weissella diestrammenae]|uniref:DUF2187 family protein n=1 Tax=Weissella diestrammenae TaxID=1162633 RepID=A0A7G9T532_9LACO|nr:hypothetical protein [Weissella diestrammenae]MCM0583061.1 hypothetical protein [Weissella diestrammenae]QNN75207.1 hypothetical protein H9L19_07530 [Weissella diestrammenae]
MAKKEPAVNTSEFDLGDYVEAPAFANFEHKFKGIVEKIYEHALLVMITENDPEDDATVVEYNRRAITRMSETKILVKTDNPAPRDLPKDEDEEELPESIRSEVQVDEPEEEEE